jgi:hypothetical protein
MVIMGKPFQAVMVAGFLGLVGMGWYQATGAGRLRARAEAGGLASTEIFVREMG